MLMFEELSDIFSDHNNHLTSRELLMKVRLVVRKLGNLVDSSGISSREEWLEASLRIYNPTRKPDVTRRQTFWVLFLCGIEA